MFAVVKRSEFVILEAGQLPDDLAAEDDILDFFLWIT